MTYEEHPDGPRRFEPDGATTTAWFTSIIRARQRGDSTPVARPDLEPIFTELARQWEAEGRLVPGRANEEGATPAHRFPWPS